MSSSGVAGRGSLPPKLYFRIGEVAGLVGVEPHVLRYWEREFRSIRPTKSAKGQRVYSRRDVENLLRVRDLLYQEGFTIAGAKKRLLRSGVEPTTQAGGAAAQPGGAPIHTHPAPATPAVLVAPAPRPSVLAAAAVGSADAASGGVRGGGSMMRGPVHEKLSALRSEVEAFLKELGG